MDIIFMGTPEFARANLIALDDSRHRVVTVVTGRDKKTGRGQRKQPTACRIEAERRSLPLLMPGSLKSDSFYRQLAELRPDLLVVAAFRILPPALFKTARMGAVNIHTSLLPKYRGAAPINWALVNGESETGLTAFFLKETVDTGDIINRVAVPINDDDTYDTLHERLSDRVGRFLLDTLDNIESGDRELLPQENAQASYAPKIKPADAMIDFGFPAVNVRNFVRGMATRPGAFTYYRGSKFKIHFCEISDQPGPDGTRPGTIIHARRKLVVQCRDSAVELTKVVPEGKRVMDGSSFINGYRPEQGEILGVMPGIDRQAE